MRRFQCRACNYDVFGSRECQLLEQTLAGDYSNGELAASWTYASFTDRKSLLTRLRSIHTERENKNENDIFLGYL